MLTNYTICAKNCRTSFNTTNCSFFFYFLLTKSISCISQPFEVSKEHQEQAKAILEDESSELLKQGSVGSEDTDVGVSFANKRERRPAYERKRGHFTFKPTTTR